MYVQITTVCGYKYVHGQVYVYVQVTSIYGGVQVRSAEVEAELDSVREEANRRISQLEGANQEQARLLQQHDSEAQGRRKQVADLEGKLHSRAGALADHSERAKQLQQVCVPHTLSQTLSCLSDLSCARGVCHTVSICLC